MADLDPRSVIEDSLAAAAGLFQDRPAELEVRLPASLPPVHADRDRLMQVIVNLLSNAAKFCDETNGRVVVTAKASHDGVLVGVTDNGPGLRSDEHQRIFEKFQQAGDQSRRPTGTGLGLPICRQIVEHFGGRIWVESRPGLGTTFFFTLPYARARAPAAQ